MHSNTSSTNARRTISGSAPTRPDRRTRAEDQYSHGLSSVRPALQMAREPRPGRRKARAACRADACGRRRTVGWLATLLGPPHGLDDRPAAHTSTGVPYVDRVAVRSAAGVLSWSLRPSWPGPTLRHRDLDTTAIRWSSPRRGPPGRHRVVSATPSCRRAYAQPRCLRKRTDVALVPSRRHEQR